MKAYYIKSKFDESKYSVLVTDLTRVWVQSCDRAEIKRLKQKLNPLVDTPMPRILQLVKQSILDAVFSQRQSQASEHQVQYQIEEQAGGHLSLHFSTKIDFYRFRWTFDCAPLSGEEQRIAFLRASFIEPLLVVTRELQQQLEELKTVIAHKDAEIAEYKSRGVKLPKALQSAPFSSEEFEARRLASSISERSLGEPIFLENTAGKIYQRLIAQRIEDGSPSPQDSSESIPKPTLGVSSTQTPSSDCLSGSQSPGESNRHKKLAKTEKTPPLAEGSITTPTQNWPSPQRSQPDYETNGLSYKESPDEVARKAAIRQLLEAKKKEKQTKTVKRKFQFI